MKVSIKRTLISGLLTMSIVSASLMAAVPAGAAAASSMTVQSKNVANGATFDVTLSLATTAPTAGVQAYLTFDASKLTVNSSTFNTAPKFFGAAEFDLAPTINNTTGNVNAITSTTGGPTTVTGSGVWVTLNITAKAAANNSTTSIHLVPGVTASVYSDANGDALATDLFDGLITVGVPAQPDLTVSNVAATAVAGDPTHYNVAFRVNNIGSVNAGASSAAIVVDAGAPIVIAVPAIAAGANANLTTASAIAITGTNDDIVITADSANAVIEGNEANNSASSSYFYQAPLPTSTDINANLTGSLTFTQPTTVSFGNLQLGNNTVGKTMNVLSNGAWTVNARGTAPTTTGGADGKLTKWNGTSYVAATKLHNALNVVATGGSTALPLDSTIPPPANYNLSLTGADQLLANGVAEGQNLDGTSGETRTVTFNQTVIGSDAAVTAPYSYHIVVAFTAAAIYSNLP